MKRKRGRRLELRTTQKTSMRYVAAAGSVLALSAMMFIYINFSSSDESKADNNNQSYKATYQTTDEIVPVRLLLKAHPDKKISTDSYNPKSDSGYKQIRIGRSIIINDDRYITQ